MTCLVVVFITIAYLIAGEAAGEGGGACVCGDGGGGRRWMMAKHSTCVSCADAHYFKDKLGSGREGKDMTWRGTKGTYSRFFQARVVRRTHQCGPGTS